MYIILDFLSQSLTGIYLTSFIIMLKYLSLKEFILSLIFYLLISNNYYLLCMLILMYLIERILDRYVNYNLLFRISIFTFLYLIISKVNIYYFTNLILVILIHFYKYNNKGDFFGQRQIFK